MSMKPMLRAAFEAELREATEAEARSAPRRAWRHLERAHVLSQAYAGPHVRVHWRMLGFGWRQRDVRELWGQVARLLVAAPGSWLGRAPLGNTGGASVGILTPMPIPDDLRAVLDADR
ncbi:DUF3703 domain-containing protein [Comamonas sp. JC664]|uniref:DUF3703 domain-containing protein n=1 Tax=Comamonas sp. JC664 TaxID=2801917 RepID=UPI00174C99B7|nr:DUF3703 domain-containing protein [Comamonas sp. JC664]MBL0695410.1 DUF3703 domain-containing protein [Comamonas sp. JC664]